MAPSPLQTLTVHTIYPILCLDVPVAQNPSPADLDPQTRLGQPHSHACARLETSIPFPIRRGSSGGKLSHGLSADIQADLN